MTAFQAAQGSGRPPHPTAHEPEYQKTIPNLRSVRPWPPNQQSSRLQRHLGRSEPHSAPRASTPDPVQPPHRGLQAKARTDHANENRQHPVRQLSDPDCATQPRQAHPQADARRRLPAEADQHLGKADQKQQRKAKQQRADEQPNTHRAQHHQPNPGPQCAPHRRWSAELHTPQPAGRRGPPSQQPPNHSGPNR